MLCLCRCCYNSIFSSRTVGPSPLREGRRSTLRCPVASAWVPFCVSAVLYPAVWVRGTLCTTSACLRLFGAISAQFSPVLRLLETAEQRVYPQADRREDRVACGQIGDSWPLRPRRRALGRVETRGNFYEWPRFGHGSRLDRPNRRQWIGSKTARVWLTVPLSLNPSTSLTRAPPSRT